MSATKAKIQIPVNISSDPEFFIKNKNTGEIVSSIPLVKHTKENPADLGDGFLCYSDNVAVECSIPVADSRKDFISLINKTKNKINQFLGEEYEVAPIAAYNFPPSQLNDPGANEIGCSPFFLSHSLEMAMPPELPPGFRSAGFHLHVGRADFKKCGGDDWIIDPMSKVNFINLMDVFVGIPSVIFDNSPESRERKKIYTQLCGSHRPCEYGAEYRPLSSACMRDDNLIGLIYDLTMMAAEHSIIGKEVDVKEEEMVECIDKHNIELADIIINRVFDSEMAGRIREFSEK